MAVEKEFVENETKYEEKEVEKLYIHKFKKPVLYNGETITELAFDFESLTGDDALNIENELASIGKAAISPAFSGEYLIRMAAKACTTPIGEDFFRKASISDYNRLRSKARSFLLASEL
ncbi:MAG: hypothetical protein DBX61_11840 [Clostridiales bacterium]|nr:MAG: hypothetical protein DBX61_11840 [Clostridiales bacterium]